MDPKDFNVMNAEWEAWQAIVRELDSRGIDVDERARHKPLVNAIRLWGERLHTLRATQTPDMVAKALGMALEGRP